MLRKLLKVYNFWWSIQPPLGDFPSEKVRAQRNVFSKLFYWIQYCRGDFVENFLCVREGYYHMNISSQKFFYRDAYNVRNLTFLSGQKIGSTLYWFSFLSKTGGSLWLFTSFVLIYVMQSLLPNLHCLAKTQIYLTPYICTERIFDSRPFMYNKIFLKNSLKSW